MFYHALVFTDMFRPQKLSHTIQTIHSNCTKCLTKTTGSFIYAFCEIIVYCLYACVTHWRIVIVIYLLLLLQSALQPLVGFWLAQLSLSLLSRKVFTECCCQQHTSNPQLGGPVIRTFQLSPASETTQANPSSGRCKYGREIAENFAESGDFYMP